jgi:hypothetical protein
MTFRPPRFSSVRAAASVYVLTAAPSAMAASPKLGGGDDLGVSLWRVVAALIACLIVALLAILMVRQRGGQMRLPAWAGKLELRPRAIRVVEARRLSPHADICLVQHAGREYLLLLMAGRAQVLRESDAPADADTPCA